MAPTSQQPSDRPQALNSLKVVELVSLDTIPYFAASMAAKALADLGAEVIKVEPPQTGSAERTVGPFKAGRVDLDAGGLHLYLNGNKLGVTLDLNSVSAREALFGLLASTDILFNPNPPSLNESLGLDWRSLTERFPNLIVVSLTYFGADSLYRDRRGGNLVATHMSVVGYSTPLGGVDDLASQPPLTAAERQADYLNGYTAAAAAMTAIFHRQRTGRGLHVDASQWLSMVSTVRPEIGTYGHEAREAPYYQRLVSRSKNMTRPIYPCSDGMVSFAMFSDRHWEGLMNIMDHPEWAQVPLLASREGRMLQGELIEEKLSEWTNSRTRYEVFELAQAAHIPCFPMLSPTEIVADQQYVARDFFVEQTHPVAGPVKMPGAPFVMSETPWQLRKPAPRLGEHNREILRERLGLDDQQMQTATAPAGGVGRSWQAALRASTSTASPAVPKAAVLPLSGIRVLDFGWVYSSPLMSAWLATLGADVIKVETALNPDLVRSLGGTDGVVGLNRSGIFNAINHSKRSLAVNLAHPRGAEICRRLAALCDIVSENFTPGTTRKYGLDYEALRRIKPDLVMFSCTSLGQTGPYAKTVGYGPTNSAFSGICYLTGYPGGPPVAGVGGTWPDFVVAMTGVFALQAALYHRDLTGAGQYIDMAMVEAVNTMLPEAMIDQFMNGVDRTRIGNRDYAIAPHGVFPVAGDDQWVALATPTDAEFSILCEELGVPGLAADPRFAQTSGRLANVETLDHEIAARTRNFGREDLVGRLVARGLAVGPVYSTEDLMKDRAFQESGMLLKINHKECGERVVPGLPVRFSTFEPVYRPAPLLGEHSEEVLSQLLGYDAKEVERLRAEQVIL